MHCVYIVDVWWPGDALYDFFYLSLPPNATGFVCSGVQEMYARCYVSCFFTPALNLAIVLPSLQSSDGSSDVESRNKTLTVPLP